MIKPIVIIPKNHPNPPEPHEVEVAWIMARTFATIVEFLIPVDGYKAKTQDMVIDGVIWEIKSPKGNAKTTVANQFKTASKQRARNIIFDTRRTPIQDSKILVKIQHEWKFRKSIKRIIFIGKNASAIELKR